MKIPGLGRLIYRFYIQPRATADARAAARELPALLASVTRLRPLSSPPLAFESLPEINMLTGQRFLHLTIFSAYSLVRASGKFFRLRVVSDGTITDENVSVLQTLFPGVLSYRDPRLDDARIEALFPIEKFPALRRARLENTFFRKLLDVHGGERGWRLYLDSDTFFHRRPDALLACMAEGDRPCYMADQWSNYGHPPAFMDQLLGHPVLRKVNAGIVGLRSEIIDWERLEFWLSAMIQAGGNFFYFEQGLTALLLSSAKSVLLPPTDYLLCPSRPEILRPKAVFHHYAGDSKQRFIRYRVSRVLFES